MTHHTECTGQGSLFDTPGPCTCPPKWLKQVEKAARAAEKATKKAARVEKAAAAFAAKAAKAAAREARRPKPNPCLGAGIIEREVPTTHYGVRYPFTPSVKQMAAYASFAGVLPDGTRKRAHKVPQQVERNEETGELEGRDTFGDRAIRQLQRNYPKDPLYPQVEGFRILQKALGTYVSKLRLGAGLLGTNGYLHDRYRHTPKTLRLAMEMLQVLPRPTRDELEEDDPKRIYDAIRRCFIPSEGHTLCAADFANIEPMLVAYFARDSVFLRACRTSSHSWFAANVIGRPTDFSWNDADISAYYHELAAAGPYLVGGKLHPWKAIRDGCKTAGMASLYAGGPGEIANANPDIFPTRTVAKYYQDAFFDLAPKVRTWHWGQAETIERQGYLLTPIGFRLHANEAFTYAKNSLGRWERSLSPVSKEVIAALPQHTGMMYLATAATAFAREYPNLAQYVRLLIHDEIFGDVPTPLAPEWRRVLASVMSRPHPLMPLEWLTAEERAVMGDFLAVQVEGKSSHDSWGAMQ